MDPVTLTLSFVLWSLLVYYVLWRPMTYFKQIDIPYEPPVPIIGNMLPVMLRRISIHEYLQQFYHRFSYAKYFGLYNFITPVVVIRDPELITHVAVKNFDNFSDHHGFVDEERDPLMGKNLFSLRGNRWREMRRLLTPSFTSSKMKNMFYLIDDYADNFADFVATQSKHGKVMNLKEIFGRYTTDVVASCNFGLAVDSMRNPKNEFYVFGTKTVDFKSALSLKFIIGNNFSMISKLLRLTLFGEEARQYFLSLVSDTVKIRKEKGIYRPDMIQLMLESKDKDGNGLTIEEMTYQAFVFFLAGFDTVSTVISFAVHHIGTNPDVQAKLRAEIEEVVEKTNGKPTYDAVKDMRYMDAVISEVLRLHPPLPFLDRVCVKEFQLPPATPRSKPTTLKPGQIVYFLPFSMQRDPKYFSEPTKFDPDRFLSNEEPPSIAYMPFGVGPRNCIGNRFGLMECKLALFYILWRCELEPCEKTAIPIKFSSKSFVLLMKDGFWLNFRARDKAYRLKGHNENGNAANETTNGAVSNQQS